MLHLFLEHGGLVIAGFDGAVLMDKALYFVSVGAVIWNNYGVSFISFCYDGIVHA